MIRLSNRSLYINALNIIFAIRILIGRGTLIENGTQGEKLSAY